MAGAAIASSSNRYDGYGYSGYSGGYPAYGSSYGYGYPAYGYGAGYGYPAYGYPVAGYSGYGYGSPSYGVRINVGNYGGYRHRRYRG